MSFIQNLYLCGLSLRHNQPILEPQGTFHILMESSDLRVTFFHSSPDVGHALVILLCRNDLVPQYGCEGDVVQ
jgi:hypothetical protein